MSEIWKPCPGYEGIYEVSNHGRVMRVAPGKGTHVGRILKMYIDASGFGYSIASLVKDRKSRPEKVHQLVCEAFHGPRPSSCHEVAHADGNPINNMADNLRWATHGENMRDKFDHGTHRVGPDKLALLNEDAVRDICASLAKGELQKVIAARYGVARSTINNIAIGKSWRHVT